MEPIPDGLEYWTADELANCLGGLSESTFQRLCEISVSSTNRKPLGGDGSNGTTEIPIVDDCYGNQPRNFWPQLTREQQQQISVAYARYRGEIMTDLMLT